MTVATTTQSTVTLRPRATRVRMVGARQDALAISASRHRQKLHKATLDKLVASVAASPGGTMCSPRPVHTRLGRCRERRHAMPQCPAHRACIRRPHVGSLAALRRVSTAASKAQEWPETCPGRTRGAVLIEQSHAQVRSGVAYRVDHCGHCHERHRTDARSSDIHVSKHFVQIQREQVDVVS